MKRTLKIFIICIAVFFTLAVTAFADMGSKPRVEITIENAPQELYYLDLLYQYNGYGNPHSNIDKNENYHPEMIDRLFSYENDGWIPAYVGGTGAPMWGSLTANENGKHIFSYFGVPDVFRVIIVTQSGQVKVSDTVERKAMEANITMNFENMLYSEKPLWQVYIGQFALTCSVTMIVELVILALFRFKITENLAVFALTNLFTQVVFTLLFASAFIYNGTIGCMTAFIPVEIGVIIAEAVIYRRLLKGQSVSMRTAYAVVANFVTALLTWVNIDPLMDFMFRLLR